MKFPRPAALAVVLLSITGGVFYWMRPAAPLGLELSTPALALTYLETIPPTKNKTLFFTPAAAGFIPGNTPETLAKKTKEFETTLHDTKAWRALDRKERFDALWLMGSPTAFKPLLDHLRQSADWKLTYLDPTSLIFRRIPAEEWSVKQLDGLKKTFASHTEAEQIAMRVQAAHRLVAIGEYQAAKGFLDEAIALDARSASAWTELACLHAAQGQWERALDASEHALKHGKNYPPALAARANALFAHGKFNDALKLTRRLVAGAPEDGPNLYLHAKVTHAAHAYMEEIETLRKIIAMAEGRNMPTGTWRVFLAQAYGATGEAELALEQFEGALKDPGLSEKEREFSEKGMERIRSR